MIQTMTILMKKIILFENLQGPGGQSSKPDHYQFLKDSEALKLGSHNCFKKLKHTINCW